MLQEEGTYGEEKGDRIEKNWARYKQISLRVVKEPLRYVRKEIKEWISEEN